MTKKEYIVTTGLGVLTLALALINGVLFTSNQSAQTELAHQQGYLQQTGQLEGIYTTIATSLAQLAIRDNDRAVIDMLASLGLKVTQSAEPAFTDEAKKK